MKFRSCSAGRWQTPSVSLDSSSGVDFVSGKVSQDCPNLLSVVLNTLEGSAAFVFGSP